jgi:hypothetical protein
MAPTRFEDEWYRDGSDENDAQKNEADECGAPYVESTEE